MGSHYPDHDYSLPKSSVMQPRTTSSEDFRVPKYTPRPPLFVNSGRLVSVTRQPLAVTTPKQVDSWAAVTISREEPKTAHVQEPPLVTINPNPLQNPVNLSKQTNNGSPRANRNLNLFTCNPKTIANPSAVSNPNTNKMVQNPVNVQAILSRQIKETMDQLLNRNKRNTDQIIRKANGQRKIPVTLPTQNYIGLKKTRPPFLKKKIPPPLRLLSRPNHAPPRLTKAPAPLIMTSPTPLRLNRTSPASARVANTSPAHSPSINTSPAPLRLNKTSSAPSQLINTRPAHAPSINTSPAPLHLNKTSSAPSELINTRPALLQLTSTRPALPPSLVNTSPAPSVVASPKPAHQSPLQKQVRTFMDHLHRLQAHMQAQKQVQNTSSVVNNAPLRVTKPQSPSKVVRVMPKVYGNRRPGYGPLGAVRDLSSFSREKTNQSQTPKLAAQKAPVRVIGPTVSRAPMSTARMTINGIPVTKVVSPKLVKRLVNRANPLSSEIKKVIISQKPPSRVHQTHKSPIRTITTLPMRSHVQKKTNGQTSSSSQSPPGLSIANKENIKKNRNPVRAVNGAKAAASIDLSNDEDSGGSPNNRISQEVLNTLKRKGISVNFVEKEATNEVIKLD